MVKCAWVLSAPLLALGIGCLAVARAPDDAEENAKIEAARQAAPDVAKLGDLIDKPDEFKKQAKVVLFKNDDLLPLMAGSPWELPPRAPTDPDVPN